MSAGITTSSASPNVAPSDPEAGLWTEIKGTYAKLKGMAELDAQALFARDSKRLDAKARATYKELGLKLEASSGDLAMIADDIALDEAARADIFKRLDDEEMGDVRIVADNITFTGGAKPEVQAPANSAGNALPTAAPAIQAAEKAASWASPLVAAVATAGLLGSGIGIPLSYYLGRQRDDPPPAAVPVDTDTNTRGILELVPEDGQRPPSN